jgi:hypothetical protein
MRRKLAALLSAIALMGLAGCGLSWNASPSSDAPEGADATSATATPTERPLEISYTCATYDKQGNRLKDKSGNDEYVDYRSIDAVRQFGGLTNCEGRYESGDLNAIDRKAVQEAGYTEGSSIGTLYGICATTIGYPVDNRGSSVESSNDNPLVNESQAKEALAALTICPGHSEAQKIKANAEAAIGANSELSAKRAAGEVLDDGTYAIGTEMKPGTWKTSTEKVSDCYWELRDANGATMQNDFIVGAPSVTVQIPSTASSFTSRSCGTWIKQ